MKSIMTTVRMTLLFVLASIGLLSFSGTANAACQGNSSVGANPPYNTPWYWNGVKLRAVAFVGGINGCQGGAPCGTVLHDAIDEWEPAGYWRTIVQYDQGVACGDVYKWGEYPGPLPCKFISPGMSWFRTWRGRSWFNTPAGGYGVAMATNFLVVDGGDAAC